MGDMYDNIEMILRDYVKKDDLNKLAEWFRKKDLNLADLDEGEQRLGYYHAYRKLDKLLEDE